MRLSDYLDKGASLDPSAPCLTVAGRARSYRDVQRLSWLVARALARSGVRPGDKAAVLSGNDPVAFSCVFGISRAGAIWCPVDPQNEPGRTAKVLDHIDCSCLIFSSAFAPLVRRIADELPKLRLLVCVDADPDVPPDPPAAVPLRKWLAGLDDMPFEAQPASDVAAIMGAGTAACDAKGVVLTCQNIETMSAATLISYPFGDRPVFLPITPLTRGVAMFTFPVMALGGEITLLPEFELTDFLTAIGQRQVTHTFLPSSLLTVLLDHPGLRGAELSSLRCVWYDGGDGIPVPRLAEAIAKIGPVMGQLYGQPEVMVISALEPRDHFRPDGTLAVERLASAGRPTDLTTVGIMDQEGRLLATGERGEVVTRGPLVTSGYYADPAGSAAAWRHGWYHTGESGYLDADNYLHIVQRARDLIPTGRYNLYAAEVERELLRHPAVRSCAVMAAPDAMWGERVTAIVHARPGFRLADGDLCAFLRERLGIRAPTRIEVWSGTRQPRLTGLLRDQLRSHRRSPAPGHDGRLEAGRARPRD
jgi:fatty-acyl-CoA synthase